MVVNKIDRPGARPDWVIDQIFDLFDNLGATDEQLDFPIIYCSALNGIAGMDPEALADNMDPMFQAIVDIVEPPKVEVDGPFQMQISALDYNSYVGVIGLGRIKRGSVKPNQQISVISVDGTTRKGKIGQVMTTWALSEFKPPKPPLAISYASQASKTWPSRTLCVTRAPLKRCRRCLLMSRPFL